jgi:prepilin-type N-terminal cleavage/methylation domain-containing protein
MKLKTKRNLLERFRNIDVNSIQDESLRKKARKLKGKQAGFTLLELLVVVAILAAIAGTATIALQDTDARASAAAHVAMMDELNKGVHTFRVLNKNQFPNDFDSMLGVDLTTDGDAGGAVFPLGGLVAHASVGTLPLTAPAISNLNDIGITSLQYLDYGQSTDLDGDTVSAVDECTAANVVSTIASRGNAVVSNNIFMTPAANGCGATQTLVLGDQILVWSGGYERLMGSAGIPLDVGAGVVHATPGSAVTASDIGDPVLMVVGVGPSSTLFNTNDLGGMTTVPVYRHVSETQYGRFAAIFNIGDFTDVTGGYAVNDQVTFIGVVDGAGDTKEEELGEWDGTRNTI